MSTIVDCPSCHRKLRVPDDLLGKKVKCPTCNTPFAATAAGPSSAVKEKPPSSSRRQAPPPAEEAFEEEELTDSKRRRQVPADDYEEEFEEEDYGEPRARGRSRRDEPLGADGPESLSDKYSISFGEWFEYAKAHYTSLLGPMIGYMLIVGLIMGVLEFIPFVGPLALIFIQPPLYGGFFVVALAQLKGKRWSFGDFFSGFQWYGALLANQLLLGVLMVACLIPGLATMFVAFMGAGGARGPSMLPFIGIGVLIINYFVAFFVAARLAFFNYPLIIDRGFGPIEAFQGSWKLGRGHAFGLFGMALLLGLLAGVGYLGCGIGFLFTAPLAILTYTAGYLLIAGTKRPLPSPGGKRRKAEEDDYD